MTPEVAMKVGMAVGVPFRRGGHRHRVVIGKDTRLSGYMLENALVAGFTAAGVDVFLLGPVPTPAVAMLTRSLRADIGVMISASHNPFQDNGIKLFGPDGYKLSDDLELEIEEADRRGPDLRLAKSRQGRPRQARRGRPLPLHRVRQADLPEGHDAFGHARRRRLRQRRRPTRRRRRRCGNWAPRCHDQQRARRLNINLELRLDQSDRPVEEGARSARRSRHRAGRRRRPGADRRREGQGGRWRPADGADRRGLACRRTADRRRHRGDGDVQSRPRTLPAGKGLELARTKVGDRYVVEHMRKHGFNVGGEQSGHIVLSDYSTTGDGLVSALQVLACIQAAEKPASEVCRKFDPVPQVLKNVRIPGGKPLNDSVVQSAIDDGRRRLGMLRPAGDPSFRHGTGDPGHGRRRRPQRRLILPDAVFARPAGDSSCGNCREAVFCLYFGDSW
jgi:phosphoglucosamine mutase